MKYQFLKETFVAIACFIALLYVIFSLGNGSLNITSWPETARNGIAAGSALISLAIVVIQAFRYA